MSDDFVKPHPNVHPSITRAMQESQIRGGVWLKDVPVGRTLHVKTRHTTYVLRHRESGWTIEGHLRYCPTERPVTVTGCTYGGSVLKAGFVGRGMYMEFCTPEHPDPIGTSSIEEITESEGV